MWRVLLIASLIAASTQFPVDESASEIEPQADIVRYVNLTPSKEEQDMIDNARYSFSVDVEDHISDLTQTRSEVREGRKLKGYYSYSDGYNKRTVHYEADENGYRVIGQEVVPLDGPHVDLGGMAKVRQNAHGTTVAYNIQSVPVEGSVGKIVDETKF